MRRPNIARHDHHLSPRPRHAPPPWTTMRTQKETTRTAGAKVRLRYIPFFFLFTDADVAASGRAQIPSDMAARGGFNTLPIRFRWVSTQTGRGRSLPYVLSTRTRPLLSHFDLLITTPAVHLHFDTGWWGNPSLPAVYLRFRWDDLPPCRLPPFKVG